MHERLLNIVSISIRSTSFRERIMSRKDVDCFLIIANTCELFRSSNIEVWN